jgi:glycosyltransferase involved in cell wall biosynthesis
MIRILFIARYRDESMRRKIDLLAQDEELDILHICPSAWRDEFVQAGQPAGGPARYRRLALPMIGRANDPHRAVYRSLAFGLGSFHADIVHAEEEPDSLAALHIALAARAFAPRAKLVLYTWQNINRPKKWHVNLVMQSSLRLSRAALCASTEAVDVLRQEGYRKPAAVLPAIGVDTRRFFPPAQPRPTGGALVVGYAGRFVPEKGVDLLISAAARAGRASPLHVRLIGDGPELEQLRELARREGIAERVTFDGPLPPAEVANRLRSLDILVLPSRTTAVWKEQFGRVLTEAMACQVPVIGSDSGAIPEVVGDAGLIFPEGDADALAGCLRRLLDSDTERRDLAERGYRRVLAHYTQERVAEHTARFYRQLMRGLAERP